MQYILALTTALAALAAAVPHPRNHLRLHHARDVSLESSVAGQSISTRDLPVDHINGICGGTTGYGCQSGYCCSQWGFCGNDADYCGVGCQSGACLATGGAAMTTSAPVQTSVIGPASPVVPVSTSTEDDSSSTAVPNKNGGGWGPGGGAPTWPASSWSAPSLPTTLVTSVWSAPVTTSTPVQQPTATSSIPAPASTGSSSGAGLGDKYVMYSGDGTASAGWPSEDSWISFETMWNNNLAIIKPSCANNAGAGNIPNNSDEENADIKSAILATAASTGVDSRFILAVILQESKGCVRIYTTQWGVRNPGLMQDHNGKVSCNAGQQNQPMDVQTPCPSASITQMIEDGVMGTYNTSLIGGLGGPGDGLMQILSLQPMSDATKYYRAARWYNSGHIDASGDLSNAAGATKCYAADIANRLTGWVLSASTCY